MRVKCIANDVNKLTSAEVRKRLTRSIHLEGADQDLVIGHIYFVVAIAQWDDGGVRIYLHTIEENNYPYPYPLEMFDVIEPSLPTNWCLSFEQQPLGLVITRISFPEWANDEHFYERLVDGDKAAIAIYKNHKESMSVSCPPVR